MKVCSTCFKRGILEIMGPMKHRWNLCSQVLKEALCQAVPMWHRLKPWDAVEGRPGRESRNL
jgi:hypothetical protein